MRTSLTQLPVPDTRRSTCTLSMVLREHETIVGDWLRHLATGIYPTNETRTVSPTLPPLQPSTCPTSPLESAVRRKRKRDDIQVKLPSDSPSAKRPACVTPLTRRALQELSANMSSNARDVSETFAS